MFGGGGVCDLERTQQVPDKIIKKKLDLMLFVYTDHSGKYVLCDFFYHFVTHNCCELSATTNIVIIKIFSNNFFMGVLFKKKML